MITEYSKVTGPHRNSMTDELAAMANTHTCFVLLGVYAYLEKLFRPRFLSIAMSKGADIKFRLQNIKLTRFKNAWFEYFIYSLSLPGMMYRHIH